MTARLTDAQAALVADPIHRELAEHAARQARQRWPYTDRDDLLQYAYLGLIDAAREWDPDRGMTFIGWARRIIRHRIVDEWRREHGRRPGLTISPFDPTADDLAPSIIQAAASVDMGYERVDDAAEAASIVDRILPDLRARDRFVITELGDGATLVQVGGRLGLTESRIAQVRSEVRAGRRQAAGVCDLCSASFMPRSSRSRYCSRTCKERARLLAVRRPRIETACDRCRKVFRPKYPHARFCTDACRKSAWGSMHTTKASRQRSVA